MGKYALVLDANKKPTLNCGMALVQDLDSKFSYIYPANGKICIYLTNYSKKN